MGKLTFNISETSQITGLSIDTLRYYDKIGLIKAKKNPKNRYRYYTIGDISVISHIKNLRDLDLSISDIKLLFNADTETQREILQNHHRVLLEKLAKIKKIEKHFKDTMDEVNSTNLMINIPFIKAYKERYILNIKKSSASSDKKSLMDQSTQFDKALDKFMFCICGDEFDSSHLFDFFEFGEINDENIYYREISEDEYDENDENHIFVPKHFYIETITRLSRENFDEYFQNLIAWIYYKNLRPIYPGFIKYLDSSLYFIGEDEFLIKFQIPFEHKKYE